MEIVFDLLAKMSRIGKGVNHLLIHLREISGLILNLKLLASLDKDFLNPWVFAHVGVREQMVDSVVVEPEIFNGLEEGEAGLDIGAAVDLGDAPICGLLTVNVPGSLSVVVHEGDRKIIDGAHTGGN